MASDPVSLNSLTFSLVGPGKVGTSLALWLVSIGGRLRQVAGRTPDSAVQLVETVGGQPTPLSRVDSDEDDLLLVAVSDPALPEVAQALAGHKQAPVVLHTSGRASWEALRALRQSGSAVGSFHPLRAFPAVLPDPAEAAGTVFGIDGDDQAQTLARRLATELSGVATFVPPAARSQYHLAATIAAGGVVTLLASAAELAETVGLGDEVVDGYLELARGAIRQAESSASIAEAITGPIARGDLEGFQCQIEELRSLDPELADLLEMLAKRTLRYQGI